MIAEIAFGLSLGSFLCLAGIFIACAFSDKNYVTREEFREISFQDINFDNHTDTQYLYNIIERKYFLEKKIYDINKNIENLYENIENLYAYLNGIDKRFNNLFSRLNKLANLVGYDWKECHLVEDGYVKIEKDKE